MEGVDEFGLPLAWRRSEPLHEAEDLAPFWEVFRLWCVDRGYRAFPATTATVLEFIRDPPVRGEELYRVWMAIDVHHDRVYWHVDANPVLILAAKNIKILPDGSVEDVGSSEQGP